jgi:Transposase DDE domain group 1
MCLLWLENRECQVPDPANPQKALRVKLPDGWSRSTPVFDDENLVSFAGLVPVMGLAERAGLAELIDGRVRFKASRVKSAGVNPAGKLTAVIAGMAAGADCIEDLNMLRSGGMPRLFGGVYAPATLGQFLREFSHGHALQLASVLRAHLVNLVRATDLLPGIGDQALIDIDSLLRPVFGHAKQGASYGHTKIAGKQVLRKGLSPLATTISTARGAPVIAGIRLRAGRAGSGKGAASMVTDAIRVARTAGATGEVLVRGDSAYGSSAVAGACLKAGARFSLVLVKNSSVIRAIATIPDHAWTPVQYPGAVVDPDTGELISDAEVAEVATFTAFGSTKHPLTARLIVRRVRDRARLEELFPVWRHHPFLTNSLEPTAQADITHRRHAIIETTFADLIDGPLAHLPSGRFAANSAWAICAAMTHNLLRAAGTLASPQHAVARGAALRRQIVTVPARLARPQRRRVLHLPAHWPWANPWQALWNRVFGHRLAPPVTA